PPLVDEAHAPRIATRFLHLGNAAEIAQRRGAGLARGQPVALVRPGFLFEMKLQLVGELALDFGPAESRAEPMQQPGNEAHGGQPALSTRPMASTKRIQNSVSSESCLRPERVRR